MQWELSWLIREHSQMKIFGTSDNRLDVLEYLQHNRVDAIFLKYQHSVAGWNLTAAEYQPVRPYAHKAFIVFITAWKKHAFATFELESFDYILKPYQESRIINILQKLKSA